MTIKHVVLMKFKPAASPEAVEIARNRLLALRENCIHPETKKPLIKSIINGGVNNSPKGYNQGFTHAFLWEFENAEDRDYYTFQDEEHKAYTPVLLDVVESIVVVDFTPGVF